MAAYKIGAFMRLKYYTPFYKTPLKWISRSKSGASKSQPRWAAHTRIGNVWECPPRVHHATIYLSTRCGNHRITHFRGTDNAINNHA